MPIVPGRTSRGRALEDEWRSFSEAPDGTERHRPEFGVTGPQPVLTADSTGPVDAPLPARLAALRADGDGSADQADPVSREAVRALVIRFRKAAVALAMVDEDRDGTYIAARDSGDALVGLAAAGAEQMLADILRPDPAGCEPTWTVACYQIGDLSPSSLRDFPAAADAVATLADCGTAAHVAAELIVTDGNGLRWTAMARSGASVSFQLLTAVTAGAQPDDIGSDLRAARNRWEDRLLSWAGRPDANLDALEASVTGESPGPVADRISGTYPPDGGESMAATTAKAAGADPDVMGRLAALDRYALASTNELIDIRAQMRRVEEALRTARRDGKRMRRRIDDLEVEVSRLSEELGRSARHRPPAVEAAPAGHPMPAAADLAPSAHHPVHLRREPAVVMVAARPARLPVEGRSRWVLRRLRDWCDERLAPSSRAERDGGAVTRPWS